MNIPRNISACMSNWYIPFSLTEWECWLLIRVTPFQISVSEYSGGVPFVPFYSNLIGNFIVEINICVYKVAGQKFNDQKIITLVKKILANRRIY